MFQFVSNLYGNYVQIKDFLITQFKFY